MDRDTPIYISLTGTDSHQIKIPAGQGSFSIGRIGMDKKKFDVLVGENAVIDWDVFNTFYTPHGQQNAHLHPYGDWPRFFYYWGNDIGFVEWSKKRVIENFFWQPSRSLCLDLSDAQIRNLAIKSNDDLIKLTLDQSNNIGLYSLHLSGKIELFEIKATQKIDHIRIEPNTEKDQSVSAYHLPIITDLAKISSLDVIVKPIGQALDCESLLQFPNLKNLNLTGNITNTACLKQLHQLERIGIRYAVNLEGFPALNTWENLSSFIAWNIDEKTGKTLNTQLKHLAQEKQLDYSSVSKLRSPIWFSTEYGIPFENWENKNAKIAIKAYKSALKKISKAQNEQDVKESIIELIEMINTLPNIETVEREDTGVAVQQLVEASKFDIDQEIVNAWFDEFRDF
ncbi:hypothetical protein [Acinetobacter bereziniae]|uniref:hypothetical protein n=1 Tax=Acinetobacter bereziniae TaxID=106648 RepID=UPI0018FFD59D|nr:hypothetical protein [Acinetobacter bereziniae]MBJ9903252.1 hypothetical protein [Acinetobacter bereziniae]MCU4317707.1 hypothetical protein [Acinetobacter bereziniae]MCU4601096.1 hypothetical protein [Acinetobacter bereziniae]